MALLEVRNVSKRFGGLWALRDVSLDVNEGEVIGIIGPNGAGKTTLLKTVVGLLKLSSGGIVFDGEDITGLPTHVRVRMGISLIPEGSRVLPKLTVIENLQVAATTKEARNHLNDTLELVYALFPILKERRRQLAGTLSGGEQRMLAIARGLISRPKLLMVDEVSLGLAPKVVTHIYSAFNELSRLGVTLLLVEQYVSKALESTDRAYLLEQGKVVLEGPSRELLKNEYVGRTYIGG